MTTFYLVRHAHATWVPEQEERPLSARGQRDALRVAELLGAQPIAAVYASTMRRAQQTVEPLAQRLGVPLQITPALDERRLCAGAVDDFQAAVRATWVDFEFAHPGGETNAAAQTRGQSLIRGLMEQHSDAGAPIVLGTHGNLLALIVNAYLPAYHFSFWQTLTMPDVYRLDPVPPNSRSGMPVLERLWDLSEPDQS